MTALLGRAGRILAGQLRAVLAMLAAAWLLAGSQAWAQSFPQLTGRVVDAANVLPAEQKARIEQKLAALEQQSQRQLVVATVPSLDGYEVSDYGYRLGRAWGLGDKERNDGAILLVAPNERKVRIEVGYGLEGIVTDGLSFLIINQQILPRFRAGDLPGGIEAGTDALVKHLTLPEDQARQIAAAAKPQATARRSSGGGFPSILWIAFIFLFFILPLFRRRGRRRRGFGGGLGQVILWDAMTRGGGGFGGGGGGFGGGFGGGGFSGGGGSFGGGGASGSW